MGEPTRSFDRGDEVELAHALVADLSQEGQLGVSGDRVFQYMPDLGIWVELDDRDLEAQVMDYAGSPVLGPKPTLLKVSHRSVRGAVGLVKAHLHRAGELDFANAPHGLTVRNGCISLSNGFVFEAPSPDQLSRFRHDFDYDSTAQAPTFLQALNDYFADTDAADAAERVSILQELCGAALFGFAVRYQACLILYGGGRNGKSTLAEILAAVFPPASVCALPPQQFRDRFRLEMLEGKLLNVVNELPASEIVGTSGFKSVVSGDECTAERKHRDAFTFRPKALHMFLTNTLPPFNDRSFGFSRRFNIVPFTRDMSTVAGYRPDFASEVVKSELPGIVNWLILGALRAQQSGITRSRASDAVVGEWRRESDVVATFLVEACDIDPAAQTQASRLYVSFATWAKNNGFKSMTSTTFGKRMRALGHPAVKGASFNYYTIRVRGGVGGGLVGGV